MNNLGLSSSFIAELNLDTFLTLQFLPQNLGRKLIAMVIFSEHGFLVSRNVVFVTKLL